MLAPNRVTDRDARKPSGTQVHMHNHGGNTPCTDGSVRAMITEDPVGRFFLCLRCRAQVVVCSCCDRGHIYCSNCSPQARRCAQRQAGRRYQASERGRATHRERSRRYRARQRRVTHHSFIPEQTMAQAQPVGAVATSSGSSPASKASAHPICHRCGRQISAFVRRDPLSRAHLPGMRGLSSRQKALPLHPS